MIGLTAPRSQRYCPDTAANANANSESRPENSHSRILATKSQTRSCGLNVVKEFASECEWL